MLPSTPPRRRKSAEIPAWGHWLICILIGLILGGLILASGIVPVVLEACGSILSGLLKLAIIPLLLALYLLPAIVASKSPRLTAILVANVAFGWTGIGWIIVLIWALAESGTINQKKIPPPP